jgi:hypothetical protein
MQTSTVSESIPITILTLPELHLGQKQSQTNTQISMDAKSRHKWRMYKKEVKWCYKNYNSYLPSVMDFTLFDAIGTVFSEDDGSWDKGMVKVYDNFANDFLYPNINNIMVLPKIMTNQ